MNGGRVVVVVALAAALAAGIALLPRSLEPGRAESEGIVLRTADSGSGDWFADSSGAKLKTLNRRLVVQTSRRFGTQVVTRPLAVFPETRYRARLSITENGTHGYVRVMDARLRHELARAPLPPQSGEVELAFDTGAERRVALVVVAGRTARLAVSEASLIRLG